MDDLQKPVKHRLIDRLPKAGGDIFLLTICLLGGIALVLTGHKEIGGAVVPVIVGAVVQRSRGSQK